MARRVPVLALLPPLLFALLAIGFYVGMQRSNPNELPSTFIGNPAPNVTEDALEGYAGLGQGGLTDGELTLVNFWASWCPPCRAEHPKLLELAGQGIRIVGINFNDKANDARKYLSDDGNPFAAIPFDHQGRTAFDWGVAAPPETFIVAADGTVLFKFIGPLVGSDYEQRFLPELQAALAAQQ